MDSDFKERSSLCIESDSKSAIAWANGSVVAPWKLRMVVNYISMAMKSCIAVSYIHTFREANDLADYLAKSGVDREVDYLEWL